MNNINFIYNKNNKFFIYIYVPCGGIFENEKNAGISHVLEHMVFKHSKDYSEKLMFSELTSIGSQYNASTDKDATIYHCISHIDNYKKVVDIMGSLITSPVFDKKEFEIEKKIIIEEINNNVELRMFNNLSLSTILDPDNAYNNLVEGSDETIKKMTIDDLKLYFRKYYKDFSIIINCDEKHKDDVKSYVYKIMGSPKQINFEHISNVLRLNVNKSNNGIYILDNKQKQYITYINFIGYPHMMLRENMILNFIKYFLVSCGLNSILMHELRNKRGLVYGVNISNEIYRYVGIFRLNLNSTNKNIKLILKVIFDVLNKLSKKGLSPELFKYYKKSYLNHMKLGFTNDKAKTEWYGKNIFYGKNISFDEFTNMINEINNEDIKTIGKQVFDLQKSGIFLLGSYKNTNILKKTIEDTIKDYGKV